MYVSRYATISYDITHAKAVVHHVPVIYHILSTIHVESGSHGAGIAVNGADITSTSNRRDHKERFINVLQKQV
jgi:hypothetical protein